MSSPLTPSGYRPRLIDRTIEEQLSIFGAVSVEGPKWCGKTWSSLSHSGSAVFINDPTGGFSTRKMAASNPETVLDGERPRLIDEWQDVPSLWDAVRYRVDHDAGMGQYLLCGSSTPPEKGVTHSGYGRYGHVRMHTMSMFETGASSGEVSLLRLMSGENIDHSERQVKLDDIIDNCLRGGWPGLIGIDPDKAALHVKGQFSDVANDICRLDGKRRDKLKVEMLLRSLARNESTISSKRTLLRDLKETEDEDMSPITLDEYLDAIDRVFLREDVMAFDPSYRSSNRVGKSPKRHLADPSLAVAGLGMGREELRDDLLTLGFVFESLCAHDLRIYLEHIGGKLYHYRDTLDREIDAVAECPDGRIAAFEIKLGTESIDDAAEKLLKMRDSFIRGDGKRIPQSLCVISGTCPHAYRRDDGVYVVPIGQLGP